MNEQDLSASEPEMFPKSSLEPDPKSLPQDPPSVSLLPSLIEGLMAQMEQGQATFREVLKAAGGGAAWLRAKCRRACNLVVGSTEAVALDLDILVPSETEAFWRGIEVRLAECERCTPEGGACERVAFRHEPGKIVRLRVVGDQVIARESVCDIYTEFKIALRLEQLGVARRLSRTKLSRIESEPRPQVLRAFEALLEAGKDRDAPKKFSLLIEGSRAREYGAALLRTVVRNFQNANIRSIAAEAFVRESKEAMTLRQALPSGALIDVDVLLIDHVPPELLKKDFSGKELRWLYTQRHDQELATIITCTIPGVVKEAFPGVSVLRV